MTESTRWLTTAAGILVLAAITLSPPLPYPADKTVGPPTAAAKIPDPAAEAAEMLTAPGYGLDGPTLGSLYGEALVTARTGTTPLTRGSIDSSTTTEVPKSEPRVRAWQPADECAKVPNPGPVWLTRNTMRWCPKVSYYLDLGERLGAWRWERGDLTRNLLIIECESGGNPAAVNPTSGTTGLMQHRREYWADRGAKAARLFGFTNPRIDMPYDNLAVGIWLAKTGGWSHWESCAGWWDRTPTALAIRETLRRDGINP